MEPVKLSLDLRAQHVVRDELVQGLTRYHAIAGIGIVLDVNTGEVVAMSSVPDYDFEQSRRGSRQRQDEPRDGRRLRDGLDLQGLYHRNGA